MREQIEKTKLFLGPMTKNIVDGVVVCKNVGLIPSRRQVDHTGGYVNNWTTETFSSYVRITNKSTLICRDHGGIGQVPFQIRV